MRYRGDKNLVKIKFTEKITNFGIGNRFDKFFFVIWFSIISYRFTDLYSLSTNAMVKYNIKLVIY